METLGSLIICPVSNLKVKNVKVKTTQLCLTLCYPMHCSPPGSSVHGDFPSKNSGVGCHVLLQGIFPTQGSNPDIWHCRQILYCLSHQGSQRILGWVAYPFSRGSSQPRNRTRSSALEADSLPAELPKKARQEKAREDRKTSKSKVSPGFAAS